MHIENVNITMSTPAFGAALLSALMRMDPPEQEVAGPEAAAAPAAPAIGQAWPGIDGLYAGLSRGDEGQPDAHLVLLNAQPEKDLNWQDAQAWAKGLGDGARLPTRFESALLYAHLQNQFDTSRWYWTGTQYSSGSAWYQDFDYGFQLNYGEEFEARARAVRRLIL